MKTRPIRFFSRSDCLPGLEPEQNLTLNQLCRIIAKGDTGASVKARPTAKRKPTLWAGLSVNLTPPASEVCTTAAATWQTGHRPTCAYSP